MYSESDHTVSDTLLEGYIRSFCIYRNSIEDSCHKNYFKYTLVTFEINDDNT